ncbi:MAG: chemotaxis protein CheB [Cellvibrio sp.]|uniref:chemotaxis protein CheB n=1 Tax=Cellvibrio sp. TaxID=1965322 RepID=UPI0031A0C6B9
MANVESAQRITAESSGENLEEKIKKRNIEAIVIGTSAGGIKALLGLLGNLPQNIPVPIIIVLHMPESRETRLAEVFQHHIATKVVIAEDKDRIKPGRVYFAGPGYHLSIERDRSFSVSCEDPVHYSRPSIDVLMASAADAYGAALAGILLTGANQDGAEGMARIHEMGGLTVVQDPAEAEIAVMPKSALDLFNPDFVFPLQEIQKFIFRVEQC